MDARREGFFWLMLVVSCLLTVWYVQRHRLPERYLEYTQGLEAVANTEGECKVLAAEIEAMRQRVANLGSDPLEMEESIRHNKDYVRKGETVYRIEKSQPEPGTEPGRDK